jgi:hypothetical protein
MSFPWLLISKCQPRLASVEIVLAAATAAHTNIMLRQAGKLEIILIYCIRTLLQLPQHHALGHFFKLKEPLQYDVESLFPLLAGVKPQDFPEPRLEAPQAE